MEECLEAMLEEERQHERNINSTAWSTATSISDNNAAELCQQLSGLRMQDDLAKQVYTDQLPLVFLDKKKKKQHRIIGVTIVFVLSLNNAEFPEHAKSGRSRVCSSS